MRYCQVGDLISDATVVLDNQAVKGGALGTAQRGVRYGAKDGGSKNHGGKEDTVKMHAVAPGTSPDER